jgi:hypothetical protein
MTLAATTVSSVALVYQSAILGYLQSALVCIPDCLRKFREQSVTQTQNESPRPLSTNSNAMLRTVALLGEPEIAELLFGVHHSGLGPMIRFAPYCLGQYVILNAG